jgi:hypothetical protein
VYLLLDQERFAILIEELENAIPDIKKPLPSAKLEKLPYLVSNLYHSSLALP